MNMEMFIDKLKNSGYEPVQSGTTGVYTFRHRAGNHIIGVMQCTDEDVIAGCVAIFLLYTGLRMFFL